MSSAPLPVKTSLGQLNRFSSYFYCIYRPIKPSDSIITKCRSILYGRLDTFLLTYFLLCLFVVVELYDSFYTNFPIRGCDCKFKFSPEPDGNAINRQNIQNKPLWGWHIRSSYGVGFNPPTCYWLWSNKKRIRYDSCLIRFLQVL